MVSEAMRFVFTSNLSKLAAMNKAVKKIGSKLDYNVTLKLIKHKIILTIGRTLKTY